MKTVWRIFGAGVVMAAALAAGPARAEVVDVDCATLERIGIPEPERFDERFCMAGDAGGLASGESRRPVSGAMEIIVAYNRATFVAVRFIGTGYRTYMELPSVVESVGGAFASWEPRNWSDERRRDRFVLADLEARLDESAPFIPCVAFLVRMKPVGQAPGFREALSGLYCGMDTLAPTEAEVSAFLDGLKF